MELHWLDQTMVLLYLAMALFCVFQNFEAIPSLIGQILSAAETVEIIRGVLALPGQNQPAAGLAIERLYGFGSC